MPKGKKTGDDDYVDDPESRKTQRMYTACENMVRAVGRKPSGAPPFPVCCGAAALPALCTRRAPLVP